MGAPRRQRGLGGFSWYIYRIRNPAFRNLIMSPRNIFRIDEAVLSLLAGDVFGESPIGLRLAVFKAIYYVTAILQTFSRWSRKRVQKDGAVETAA